MPSNINNRIKITNGTSKFGGGEMVNYHTLAKYHLVEKLHSKYYKQSSAGKKCNILKQ
jgi:hypothetical protein